MRIILTHEQADFDAIASMFGAYLLDDTALPVLPRRVNRNVRAFLTLYGVDFPFIDPRDLPIEPIEGVTLVDTQSVVSIKGMSADTRYHIIDHHSPRNMLPANWSGLIDEVGATTTLLIEALRERDSVLTPMQATLLLLGIYEDTGSLVYSRTTARDLRAAAYLLEQGASLTISSAFLNHPLSLAQQTIYDELRANSEHFHIHGHTVILACADAGDVDEELSTIVHRLRDLLDPDAIFVLISTRNGVQLIARSTDDHIDVAEIAGVFGGGGHERAAAALIRNSLLEQMKAELRRILPDHVRPAITVAQIMSRGLQVVASDTPVEDVARRMRRYGYEGYPVVAASSKSLVEDGTTPLPTRVVGLVTRRAVDRALSHKLNLTASSLMEAGEVIVHPDDSVEDLMRLMTETGWGQVPVVDSRDGAIIGIVTRTDLLKTLAPQPGIPGRQNLASRLETTLPPANLDLLKRISQTAHNQRTALYLVGGFVRDLLLDHAGQDFDLVVEGDAIGLARALEKRYGGRVTSHSRFGTAKWYLQHSNFDQQGKERGALNGKLPEFLDLVTARTEFYTYPTALPTVERGSIKLDLHRRDFTINTLALRLDGSHFGDLYDYWGGLNDLRQGLVRVLHSLSFVDDPTRILRAVRFEQRFSFRIEDRTLQLLFEAIPMLDRLSGDRIRHELNHILAEPMATHILARLDGLGLIAAIHPALRWDNWLQERIAGLPTSLPDASWDLHEIEANELRRELGYVIWLLRLPRSQALDVAARLRLSAFLRAVIDAACDLWRDLPKLSELSPSEFVGRIESAPPLARFAVYLASDDQQIKKDILTYNQRWRKVSPVVTGHDLRARGLPPGPAYKYILNQLRAAWLDENITSPEQELALLDKLICEAGTDIWKSKRQ